jgi:hypothetical protein
MDSISDRGRTSDSAADERKTISETVKYSLSNPIPEEDAIDVLNALCDKFLDMYSFLPVLSSRKFPILIVLLISEIQFLPSRTTSN